MLVKNCHYYIFVIENENNLINIESHCSLGGQNGFWIGSYSLNFLIFGETFENFSCDRKTH